MRRLYATLCAVALMVAMAAPAVAAPRPKIKRFDLLGSEIEGTLISPKGRWLFARPKVIHKTLIDYRANFDDYMLKMTEDF